MEISFALLLFQTNSLLCESERKGKQNILFNKQRSLSHVLHCDKTRRVFENSREM